MLQDLTKIRRELHRVPEKGFKEHETSNIIKKYLTTYGYECVKIAKTGVLAIKKGLEESAIAFRADMDGLEVMENTNVDYTSQNKGYMHACGHDGHMAILLGFAKYISELSVVNKSIAFIFQPAEEGPGGAKTIIDEGVLEKYNIKSIFALHVYPELEEGQIGIRSGNFLAQAADIIVKINGKSTHGAMPHLGVDPIYVASHLIQSYQSIVSRNIEPQETSVITFGTINGGEALNAVANYVNMTGSVRVFDIKTMEFIKKRMLDINEGLEKMFGVKIEFEFNEFYPVVRNDSNLYELVLNALEGENIEILKPLMISEDFSYYQQVVPGMFIMLGARNKEKGYVYPLHSCHFNFDESILQKGVETYIKICKQINAI